MKIIVGYNSQPTIWVLYDVRRWKQWGFHHHGKKGWISNLGPLSIRRYR